MGNNKENLCIVYKTVCRNRQFLSSFCLFFGNLLISEDFLVNNEVTIAMFYSISLAQPPIGLK